MNVTVGTNARRRFFNRQTLNTFCHIFFIFEEGDYGICAINALCAPPSSFYTTKVQNNSLITKQLRTFIISDATFSSL